MNLLIFFILLSIFILIFILLKNLKGSIIISLVASALIAYFIFYPKLCLNSTLAGSKLFFSSVFPSIFPFLIMCNILFNFNGISIYSKLLGPMLCKPFKLTQNSGFVLFVSALCGNPLGAKYSIDLYEKNAISKDQCERLICIASNVSPLFAIGAVGTALLGSPKYGYILLLSNYLSCITMGLLLSLKSSKNSAFVSTSYSQGLNTPNLGSALKDSIDNAIKTTLSVGGYIIIFYVIIDIVGNSFFFNYIINMLPRNLSFLREIIKGASLGMIELTKGCYILSQASIHTQIKLPLIGFLMGFSGLSIITQIYSFTAKYTEFKISLFIKRKVIQGFINGLIAYTLFYYVNLNKASVQTINLLSSSENIYIVVIIILLLLPFILRLVYKLIMSFNSRKS